MASLFGRRGPLDVRVVALPEGVEALLQDLATRLAAVEEREAALRETLARLEERIEALKEEGPGMRLGAGGPVLGPEYQKGAEEADNQVVGMRELAGKLAQGIFDSQPEESAFTLDNVEVDLAGAPGVEGDSAIFGVNPRRAVTGESATRVKFSLKRKPKTKLVE